MTAYTNHKSHGGDFGKEILKNLKHCMSIEIASGYFGISQFNKIRNDLLSIAAKGHCKILIGMALKDGVSKDQYDAFESLPLL